MNPNAVIASGPHACANAEPAARHQDRARASKDVSKGEIWSVSFPKTKLRWYFGGEKRSLVWTIG